MTNSSAKNVILDKHGKWSLILFISSFILTPLIAKLIEIYLLSHQNISVSILTLPFTIIILILLGSIVLGLRSIKFSKFPLLWVIPSIIITATFSYSIATDLFRTVDPQFIETKSTPQTQISFFKPIGVNLNPDKQTEIIAVYLNSAAEEAGLQNGDIIISVNQEKVITIENIWNVLNKTKAQQVTLEILRNNEHLEIHVKRHLN